MRTVSIRKWPVAFQNKGLSGTRNLKNWSDVSVEASSLLVQRDQS